MRFKFKFLTGDVNWLAAEILLAFDDVPAGVGACLATLRTALAKLDGVRNGEGV